MSILFALLSAVLFLDCIVLILLVLLQLPKKDAGAGGLAFGGSATDALFGAGSGNALTTITKYSAGIFFGVALLMCIITAHRTQAGGGGAFEDALTKSGASSGPIAPSPSPSPITSTNPGVLTLTNTVAPSNSSAPAAPSNSAAPPATAVPTPAPATTNK